MGKLVLLITVRTVLLINVAYIVYSNDNDLMLLLLCG